MMVIGKQLWRKTYLGNTQWKKDVSIFIWLQVYHLFYAGDQILIFSDDLKNDKPSENFTYPDVQDYVKDQL